MVAAESGKARDAAPALSRDEIRAMIASDGVQCLPIREQELIRLRAEQLGDAIKDVLVPVNMSEMFASSSSSMRTKTLTPRLCLFSWKLGRPLLGYEHLKIQAGVHDDDAIAMLYPSLDDIDDDFLRGIAGDSFTNTAFVTFFLAVIGNVTCEELAYGRQLHTQHNARMPNPT